MGQKPYSVTAGCAGPLMPMVYPHWRARTGRLHGVISNIVDAQSASIPSPAHASDYLWQWGQWLDHELDLTDAHMPLESAPIPVPAGDPVFDPNNTGTQALPFNRSLYNTSTVPAPTIRESRSTSSLPG